MKWIYRGCVWGLAVVLAAVAGYAQNIHDAVKDNMIDEVRRLTVSDTLLINAVDDAGETPLHLACRAGRVEIADYLIDAGADLNLANKQGMTPLRVAISAMKTDIVRLLLERAAGADDTHPVFGSVMSQAFATTCQNQGGPELVEALIEHGLSLDADRLDALGMSPLDWAAHFGNPAMAQLALEYGADVNHVSQRLGRTALVAAVSKGNSELASTLLAHGANGSIADKYGYPPVFYAVDKGRTAILKELLSRNASVDFAEPHYGRSLIHLAALKGFRDIAELLVSHGVDISAVDGSGQAPLFYAAKYGNRNVVEYLLEQGASRQGELIENYGVSPWLTKNMDANEASIWYLNHRGWAVKTKSRLLVFDAEEFEVRRSDNPCLANGFLTAEELNDQNVVGLYSCYHGRPGEPECIHDLSDSLRSVAYVHLVDDAWRGSPNTTYLKGHADTSVAEMRVQTVDIAEYMPMLAYMCHLDGLSIYYQAFQTDDPEKLRLNYEFLKQFVDTVDLAFLPMPEADQQEPDVKLFFQHFPARTVILLDASRREYMFPDAARQIAALGYPIDILCAENPGDRLTYRYPKKEQVW